MSIRKIRTGAHNPALRQKAKKIEQIDSHIQEVVLDMIDTLKSSDIIAGLAAPQINQSLRIITFFTDINSREVVVLINPRITKFSRKTNIMEESCLSLPDIHVPVKRSVKISVEAMNKDGQPVKFKFRGFAARAVQHEVDHLEGILIVDKHVS